LLLALCYQQLLRRAKCFELNGSNVVRQPDFFLVEVELAKNNPDGFSFKIPVDGGRASCVGQFLADFILKMGIIVGNPKSFFTCKVALTKGVLKAVPSVKVANSTMRASCKGLIEAAGIDSSNYASHLCKRGWGGGLGRYGGRAVADADVVGQARPWLAGTPRVIRPRRRQCPRPSGSESWCRLGGESVVFSGLGHNGVVLRLGLSIFFFFSVDVGRSTLARLTCFIVLLCYVALSGFGAGRSFLRFV
jgi:hypothetical protein